jgi:hypothetical protein
MFFDKNEIEELPDYGEMVRADDFIKKVEEVLTNNGLIINPDYVSGDYINLKKAITLLNFLSNK